MTRFAVSIDGGPEQQLDTATGIYAYAVAAVPAIFGTELPIIVKIWSPGLLPEYGPYYYRVEADETGHPRVVSLTSVRRDNPMLDAWRKMGSIITIPD